MATAKKKSASKRGSMRDAARQRANERQSTGGGGTKFIFPDGHEVKFFKPEKGKMSLDFIPYEVTADNHPIVKKGELWYERTMWVHNGIGPEEKSYLCLKTIGKRCPICEAKAAMMKSADADEDIIKALTSKERQVFNVIDLADKKAGVQLWDVSYHLFGKLLETEIRESDPDDGYDGFADLEGGKTLVVRFKEKTFNRNTFLETDRIDFKDRDDYDEEILEDALDLDAILNVLPYEKLDAIYTEVEDDEPAKPVKSEKKEKEEKPAKSSKKPAKDEEDDEKPTRASKSEKKAPKKPTDPEDMDRDQLIEYIEEKELDIKVTKKMDEDDIRAAITEAEADPEDEAEVDLDEMDREELIQFIEDNELEIKVTKKMDEDDIREAIAEAMSEEEPEEEEEKPAKKSTKSKAEEKPAKKSSKGDDEECPVKGGTFGTDCDEYDECFDCDNFAACKAANDAAKKSKKK